MFQIKFKYRMINNQHFWQCWHWLVRKMLLSLMNAGCLTQFNKKKGRDLKCDVIIITNIKEKPFWHKNLNEMTKSYF